MASKSDLRLEDGDVTESNFDAYREALDVELGAYKAKVQIVGKKDEHKYKIFKYASCYMAFWFFVLFTASMLSFLWVIGGTSNPPEWIWWNVSLIDALVLLSVSLGLLVAIGVLEDKVVAKVMQALRLAHVA